MEHYSITTLEDAMRDGSMTLGELEDRYDTVRSEIETLRTRIRELETLSSDMAELAEFYQDREAEEREDQFRDDVEADADALASAGWGTDEDYGYYGE